MNDHDVKTSSEGPYISRTLDGEGSAGQVDISLCPVWLLLLFSPALILNKYSAGQLYVNICSLRI
jgi:hypothetical protein